MRTSDRGGLKRKRRDEPAGYVARAARTSTGNSGGMGTGAFLLTLGIVGSIGFGSVLAIGAYGGPAAVFAGGNALASGQSVAVASEKVTSVANQQFAFTSDAAQLAADNYGEEKRVDVRVTAEHAQASDTAAAIEKVRKWSKWAHKTEKVSAKSEQVLAKLAAMPALGADAGLFHHEARRCEIENLTEFAKLDTVGRLSTLGPDVASGMLGQRTHQATERLECILASQPARLCNPAFGASYGKLLSASMGTGVGDELIRLTPKVMTELRTKLGAAKFQYRFRLEARVNQAKGEDRKWYAQQARSNRAFARVLKDVRNNSSKRMTAPQFSKLERFIAEADRRRHARTVKAFQRGSFDGWPPSFAYRLRVMFEQGYLQKADFKHWWSTPNWVKQMSEPVAAACGTATL